MGHLLKSELSRFRTVGLVLAIAFLALLRWAMIFGPLYEFSVVKLIVTVGVCAACGLTLGLYQIGSHRKPGRWAFLVHRPLAPKAILAALAGAGSVWLAGVIGLPLMAITLYADFLAPEWVDARHYGMIPFVLGIALAFYGVGIAARLSPSRLAPLFGVLPIFFLTHDAIGWWVVVPLIAVLVWLALLAGTLFKPDLDHVPRHARQVVLAALPIQYALWGISIFAGLLLYSTVVAFQEHGWKSYAAMAWNDYFPLDSIESMGSYRSDAEVLELGLGRGDDERAAVLGRQIALADVTSLRPTYPRFPTRHEPMFTHPSSTLVDGEREIAWRFVHDEMLFLGRNLRTGAVVGWLGPDGRRSEPDGERFARVPRVAADRYLVTLDRLYEVEPETERVGLRVRLDEGERFASAPRSFGSVKAVLSDRALYLFEQRPWREHLGPMTASARIPLPDSVDNLSRVTAAELIDGHVVSFVFGAQSGRGLRPAFEWIVEVGVDGTVDEIARRPLVQGVPDLVAHRAFILSPVIQTFHDVVWSSIGPRRPERLTLAQIITQPLSKRVLGWTLILSIVSAAAAWTVARRRRLRPVERWVWTAVAFGCGLPGWLGMLALTPRPEDGAGVDERMPAITGALATIGGGGAS
ncbi:MAG: hypothetical protein AAGE94_11040 [Acidobacteriota bacterium]